MTPAFIARVCEAFPLINPEYLSDEKAENMLIPVHPILNNTNDMGQTTKNEKLRIFVDYLKSKGVVRTDADFANIMGRNKGNLSEILSGKNNLTPQFIYDIAHKFPELNPNFLSDPDCALMLITDSKVDSNSNITQSPSATINAPDPELIRSLRDEIVRLNDQILWMRGLIDQLVGKQ